MSDQEFILAPPTVRVNFSLAPVRNHFNSLSLLNQTDDLLGFGGWVEQTYEDMSAERREQNVLVLYVLHDWDTKSGDTDFYDYINRVRGGDPMAARDALVNHYLQKVAEQDAQFDVTPEAVMQDVNLFVDLIEKAIGKHYEEKGKVLDLDMYARAFPLLQQPEKALETTIEHLTFMWETYLKDDWERNLPMLTESMMAFRQLDYRGQTATETVRLVTGRDLAGYWDAMDNANNITFIPSAHIGPYVTFHGAEGNDPTNYLVFGARVPEGVTKSPALSRSEVLVRLSALSDDTRLKILELMTQHEEVCAQDIIVWLNLSQSSASRHLRQLTATGYLTERRREVAKCYTLNRDRIDDTLFALKHFLKM
ncbi:MAG: metalloregulator ArsR/SmtB family transcription factor [Aggregatilineales bacterium]